MNKPDYVTAQDPGDDYWPFPDGLPYLDGTTDGEMRAWRSSHAALRAELDKEREHHSATAIALIAANAERDKLKEELANSTWENNRKLTARVSELERALQTIIDGIPVVRAKPYRTDGVISKMDYCPHNLHVYEDCGECISDFARAALQEKP